MVVTRPGELNHDRVVTIIHISAEVFSGIVPEIRPQIMILPPDPDI